MYSLQPMESSGDEGEEEEEYIALTPLFGGVLPFGSYRVSADKSIVIKTADFHSVPSSLFATDVWGGAIAVSDYFKDHPQKIKAKNVIEFGAASALPSLVSLALQANFVCCTDYPNPTLIKSIKRQFQINAFEKKFVCTGHKWGESVDELLGALGVHEDAGANLLVEEAGASSCALAAAKRYDVVILAECFWVDTYCEHENLLKSVDAVLASNGEVFVAHTHHNPGHEDKDLEFFARAMENFDFETSLLVTRHDLPYIDQSEVDDESPPVFLRRMVRRSTES